MAFIEGTIDPKEIRNITFIYDDENDILILNLNTNPVFIQRISGQLEKTPNITEDLSGRPSHVIGFSLSDIFIFD